MGRPRAGRLSSGADPRRGKPRLARQGDCRQAELQLLGPSPSTEPRGGPRARRHLLPHLRRPGLPVRDQSQDSCPHRQEGEGLGYQIRSLTLTLTLAPIHACPPVCRLGSQETPSRGANEPALGRCPSPPAHPGALSPSLSPLLLLPPSPSPNKGNISGQPLHEVRSPAGEAPTGGGKVGSDVPFLQAGPQGRCAPCPSAQKPRRWGARQKAAGCQREAASGTRPRGLPVPTPPMQTWSPPGHLLSRWVWGLGRAWGSPSESLHLGWS